uniref:Uncharacterized protein n=1 Tax=Arundo donax TaxID=35708 RepID=A0A0A9BK15_ARUDO
MEHVGEMD